MNAVPLDPGLPMLLYPQVDETGIDLMLVENFR